MTFTSGIAIYFILWWVVLFAVLPFGVKSHHEAGVPVERGHADAAPVEPMMLKKVIATTLISAGCFIFLYWLIEYSGITLDDFPFMPNFRNPNV
jgi:predicted secreted protein